MRKPQQRNRDTEARRIGIARVLSKLGVTSRTLAAAWVKEGRVSLNGKVVRDPETPVAMERDLLCVDDVAVHAQEKRYVMLNKPRGLVTTRQDEQGRDTVYSCLIGQDAWLAPVGRLDKASEGLLLFTNDSAWAARLTDPASEITKTYHVQVDRTLDQAALTPLRNGVPTEGGSVLRANGVSVLRQGEKNCWLEITLCEGKNRHIRRLCEAVELNVLRLIRVAIGSLTLGALAKGASRPLSETEVRSLRKAVSAHTETNVVTPKLKQY